MIGKAIVSATLFFGVVGGIHNSIDFIKSGYDTSEKSKLEIIKKSEKLYSINDILKELRDRNFEEFKPISLIIDYKNHGISTYSVIETNLKNSGVEDPNIFFISKYLNNSDEKTTKRNKGLLLEKYNFSDLDLLLKEKEFNVNDLLELIAKEYPNNEFFVNMSYGSKLDILTSSLGTSDNQLFTKANIDKIKGFKEENFKLIELLDNNPNLHIIQSAGNNIKTYEGNLIKNVLNNDLMHLSNGNLIVLNNLIEIIYKDGVLNKNYNLDLIKIQLQLVSKKEIPSEVVGRLVKFGIADYSINYQQLNLVEQLEYLKTEKGINLSDQINIAKAFTHEDLIINFENIKGELPTIAYLRTLVEHSIDSGKSESFDEIKSFDKLIQNIDPSFKYNTTYGSIINPYKYSGFYSINPINHDLPGVLEAYNGTSAAAPQQSSKQVIDFYKNGIDLSIDKSIKKVDYDYENIGIFSEELEVDKELNINGL